MGHARLTCPPSIPQNTTRPVQSTRGPSLPCRRTKRMTTCFRKGTRGPPRLRLCYCFPAAITGTGGGRGVRGAGNGTKEAMKSDTPNVCRPVRPTVRSMPFPNHGGRHRGGLHLYSLSTSELTSRRRPQSPKQCRRTSYWRFFLSTPTHHGSNNSNNKNACDGNISETPCTHVNRCKRT